MTDDLYEQQAEIFQQIYERTEDLLKRFGKPDRFLEPGDYSVYGDYWGHPQVKISVENLEILRPHVVKALQGLLSDFPGWEFVVAVTVNEHLDDWPEMGLFVREHEIVDGLQRQFFPPEFQDLRYEGSRPPVATDFIP